MKKFFLILLSLTIFIGCNSDEDGPVTCEESGLAMTAGAIIDVDCGSGGSVVLGVEGGEAPYQYSLDGLTFQPLSAFTDLNPGVYTATVIDVNGCEATDEFAIEVAPGVVSFGLSQTAAAGCGSADGVVVFNASGGSGEYEYQIGTGQPQDSPTFEEVPAGETEFIVRDSDGCEVSITATVVSGVSFNGLITGQSESILDLVLDNCATSGCHVAGTGLPNFENPGELQANAARVKSLTQDGTMPRNGSLTQEQIDLLACWVDDGAPINN